MESCLFDFQKKNKGFHTCSPSVPGPAAPGFAKVAFVVLSEEVSGLTDVEGIHGVYWLIHQREGAIAVRKLLENTKVPEVQRMSEFMQHYRFNVDDARTRAH